jgi:UDP-N-acetylglucosamine:LPS N-acetylglucosamine transferase
VSTPHALLLSGSLGMGHDVMAEACAVSLEQRGWTSATMNSLALMGPSAGGWGERAFRGLLSIPGVYDAFHFEQLRTGGRLARGAERASSRYAAPALQGELTARPAELIISVFATGASAAGRVKASGAAEFCSVVFCTDVNPHRLWVHDATDLYLVTSETARRFVWRFHPDAEVAVVPTPVRPAFYAAPTQVAARAELGLPADAPCVLLMAGAWGAGPLVDAAAALAASDIHTLAVAGRNPKLEAGLRAAADRHPTLVPFGFTDRIPTLMAAADLVVTTSGDTCSEARVIGRPIVLLDLVPGHGRENLQHELERGDADVAPAEPEALVRSVRAALERTTRPVRAVVQTVTAWEDAFDAALTRLGFGSAAHRAERNDRPA